MAAARSAAATAAGPFDEGDIVDTPLGAGAVVKCADARVKVELCGGMTAWLPTADVRLTVIATKVGWWDHVAAQSSFSEERRVKAATTRDTTLRPLLLSSLLRSG